ncbi:MAG: T9SS type A sorting domain-containing protein [Flavobacteriales bacterium]|nr:T9SS type A sorting domain-containing protein [Flavobacteriales bacterium]
MPRFYFLMICLFISSLKFSYAQNDTIQTFTFRDSSIRTGKFLFPSSGKNYRKVLMFYTLKCYPTVSYYDKKYPCGEWDYLTYTTVTDTSGTVYEIGRFITPYGIKLDLGPDGFTWIYDVTDYQHLLRDSVKLSSANTQELHDLKFVFYEGNSPAEVIKINQIWHANRKSYKYSDLSANTVLKDTFVVVEPNANYLKYIGRITGHGHNSNDGSYPHCCEWRDNTHALYSKNTLIKEWKIWQTLDCADNPVFPQGGTWPYAREGWCPGDRVKDTQFDVTKYATNDSLYLDYRITPVPTDNQGMGNGNYIMAMHLIQYGVPRESNDAEIYDILTPNNAQIQSKFNPSCVQPKIVLRNNSTDTMTSADLEYSISGGYTMKYRWQGKLGFLQTQTIELPIYDGGFYRGDGKNIFKCTVLKRNRKLDSYSKNNSLESEFNLPDVYNDKFYVEFKTNNVPQENRYEIRDALDSVILKLDNLKANTIYRDTLHNLKPGCYHLELIDEGTDGLSFWANTGQGSGYMRFRGTNVNKVLKNFGADFGYRLYYSFIYDSIPGGRIPKYAEQPEEGDALILPNPNNGTFRIITAGLFGNYDLELIDGLGRIVYKRTIDGELDQDITVNDLNFSPGVYGLKISNSDQKITKKILIQR